MTTKLKIEKGIIPPDPKGGITKYPFDGMNVGDSILFDKRYFDCWSAETAARIHARKNGRKVSTRKVDNGTRVWRVE